MLFLNDDYEIMPLNANPSRWHEIEFTGFKKCTISQKDETVTEIMLILSTTINKFIEIYKDRFAFTEPEFGFRPLDGIFFTRIGMIEIERINFVKKT